VANINVGCPLCVSQGHDGDFCRHGARDVGNGYYVCNWTGTRFRLRDVSSVAGGQALNATSTSRKATLD
jgi:hypothetical protein